MSITLSAYPMAFLVNPNSVKNEEISLASDKKVNLDINDDSTVDNLVSIRVLSNLTFSEVDEYMSKILCSQLTKTKYVLPNSLNVELKYSGKYCQFLLSGCADVNELQINSEEFFQYLDSIANRNVRLIDSNEFFYYNYSTSYTSITDIYKELKQKDAVKIYALTEEELIAQVDGQSVRYFKEASETYYTLEVEQKITILNIGVSSDYEGTSVSGILKNLKIQTNIKPEELKPLLRKANYLYYSGNSQTPLKNSDAVLNWGLKDGYYYAEFSGANNLAITKEAEILFNKMNKVAGRDLRFLNEQSTVVYTYDTNYTDKAVLINTLTEHGAEEIEENDGEISCMLFGMEMIYYKKSSENSFTLDITKVSDKAECQDVIKDLNEEYALNIQEITYNKIKERLDKENMRLESETVLDDNSIVLTIDV